MRISWYFKCSPFGLQMDSFYTPKGLLLQVKRATFAMQKDSFWKRIAQLLENKDFTDREYQQKYNKTTL